MRKLHIGVLVVTLLILGGLLGYSLVQNGYVPVALVDSNIVWLKEVEENTTLSRHLYRAGLVEDAGEYATLFSGATGSEQLVRKVFESLIEGAILETAAPDAVKERAAQRVAQSLSSADAERLRGSIQQLYGWEVGTFAERILQPQALQEVLIEEQGEQYEAWVRAARRDAQVHVWFLPYEWQGGELVSK